MPVDISSIINIQGKANNNLNANNNMDESIIVQRNSDITDTQISTLPCGHRFHVKCISQWMLQKKNICPMCREKINVDIPENDDEDKIPSKLIIQLLKPESVQSFSLLISGKKSDEQIVCIDQLKISLLAKGCLCKGIISLISNLITEKKPEYGHR